MSTADVTGPLAPLFAQVREALDEICPQEYVIDCDLPEHQTARDGHAALSSIERHVQDMETALEQARECCARPSGVCFDPAALPAREKEEECPAGHGSQCCGYPDECREALKEAR